MNQRKVLHDSDDSEDGGTLTAGSFSLRPGKRCISLRRARDTTPGCKLSECASSALLASMLAFSASLKDRRLLDPGDRKVELALTDCLGGCRLVCGCQIKVFDVDWPGALVLAQPASASRKDCPDMNPAMLSSRFFHEKNLSASASALWQTCYSPFGSKVVGPAPILKRHATGSYRSCALVLKLRPGHGAGTRHASHRGRPYRALPCHAMCGLSHGGLFAKLDLPCPVAAGRRPLPLPWGSYTGHT